MSKLYEASEDQLSSAAHDVPELKRAITVWLESKRQLTAMGIELDVLVKRDSGLEESILPRLQDLAVQEVAVDDAIIKLDSHQSTSTDYRKTFNETLQSVNTHISEVLTAFQEIPQSAPTDDICDRMQEMSTLISRAGTAAGTLSRLSVATQIESFVADEVLAGTQVEEALLWLR